MAIAAAIWLDIMRREYLGRFVPEGGASTKFVIFPDDPAPVVAELRSLASEQRLLFVPVDSAETKIHMIQDVFFAISRSVPWQALAQRWIERTFAENRYGWTRPGEAVPLRELADANHVDEVLLRKSILQWVSDLIMRDRDLAQDFRAAMVNLCLQRMAMGDASTVAPVLDWLRGELRTIGSVRQVPISSKITRHNGRAMLRSLCHWLRLSGEPGLLVVIDIRHALVGARDAGVRYSPAALLDLYEVLRQLIDDVENVSGLFVAVIAEPGFRDGDPKRNVGRYLALKERIWADVHARGHDNPVAPMLQLDIPKTAPAVVAPDADLPISEERVAIEALRAGVPNRTAIRLLGSPEEGLIQQFRHNLADVAAGLSVGIGVSGTILSGGFGAGKSHLLGVLAENALEAKFVVSVVPVSKETPLFDPGRFFLAAMRAAVAPGANDDAMTEVLSRLNATSDRYAALEEWASGASSGISPLFAAILYLLRRQALSAEDKAAVARFFAGHRLGLVRVKQALRSIGAQKPFDLGGIREADLVEQRRRFAPRLFAAAGFAGWAVLIDEVELIGRYSALQRGKSYAELARWLALGEGAGTAGIASVAAIVTDFKDVVLGNRLDLERVPTLLRDRGLDLQAERATAAMAALDGRAIELRAPDEERLKQSLARVGQLYRASYGWTPPEIAIGPRRQSKSVREYIKSWITEWDLTRIYGEPKELSTDTIPTDLTENLDLEKVPADSTADA